MQRITLDSLSIRARIAVGLRYIRDEMIRAGAYHVTVRLIDLALVTFDLESQERGKR